jgi:hypothetical protein
MNGKSADGSDAVACGPSVLFGDFGVSVRDMSVFN